MSARARVARGGRHGGSRLAGRLDGAGVAASRVRRPWRAGRREATTSSPPPSYRITTLHPRTYNEARTIGEHFRAGTPVIMNLSEMDDADAKRLVDFAAGPDLRPARAHRAGHRQGVPALPHNVTVTAEDKARIADGAFFNQS